MWRLAIAAVLVIVAGFGSFGSFRGGAPAPPPPTGVVMSKNFFNNSGSSTPAGGTSNTCAAANTCFPVHTFAGFAPGTVPSGSIAVPTVGGNPIRYQADRCARPWADGSSSGCQFSLFIPQIGAHALEQVVWTVQAGSYNNTSACTISCVTSNGDLRVKLTDVNQTGITSFDISGNVQAGAYIDPSTGAVTSAVVRGGFNAGAGPCTSNICHATVYSYVNAGGSGNCVGSPAFTINNLPATGIVGATTTVTTAGSGCPMGPGSSNATAAINTALGNGAYNSSNHCGIVRQYLQGPVADGWEVACRFTDDNGTTGQWAPPAPVMRAWVEDWKNADGTVYALRAMAMVTQDQYVHLGTLSPFTYDVQWYNGATPTSGTCIRCASQGYIPLTRIVQQFSSAGLTLEPDARMDWIPVGAGPATSAELNAVVGTYQAADKVYFKGSHLIPPIDDNVTVGNYILTQTGTQLSTNIPCCSGDEGSFNSNTLGGQSNHQGYSSGGDHDFFFIPASNVIQYLAMTQASDYGFSMTQNNRVASATNFSCNAGTYDPDTRYAIDLIASASWTPPAGMVARPNASKFNSNGVLAADMIGALVPCWVNNGNGWGFFFETSGADYSHWQNYSRWSYVQEGEEWQLQAMDAAAQDTLTNYGSGYSELGSAFYYGTAYIIAGGNRLPAWSFRPLIEATKFLPPTDINAQYDYQIMMNHIAKLGADTYAFTGTVTTCYFFCGPFVGTKPFDITSGGWLGGALYYSNAVAGTANATISGEYFTDAYLGGELLDAEMLFPADNSNLDNWAHTYVDNYIVGRAYQNRSCTVNWLDYIGYNTDSDKRQVAGWEADSSNAQHFNEYIWNFAGPTITTYSGDPIVDMSAFAPSFGPIQTHSITATAPVTVNPAGTTTISVSDVSLIQLGAVVADLGAGGCFPSCPGVGGALPTQSGAIPHHMFVSAISGTSGAGTISIKCGATGGCSSPTTTVNSGDVLAYSFRLDFPPSIGSDGSSPLSQSGNSPMPGGTLMKPIWEGGSNSGDNHLGSFPPTTSPANGINDSVTTGGYVWCPDAANPQGTTGTILPHGGTCGVTAPFNYAADGAVTWGFAPPLSACTGMIGNWRYGGGPGTPGNINLKTEEDQALHLARFAIAVWGSNTARSTVASEWPAPPSIYTGNPELANFAWDSSFSYPTPPGH